jgi:hypothetical protein
MLAGNPGTALRTDEITGLTLEKRFYRVKP